MSESFCESRCLWATRETGKFIECGMPKNCTCPIGEQSYTHGVCFFCKHEYPKHRLISRPEGWLCMECYRSREYRMYRDKQRVEPPDDFDVFCTSCGSIVSIYDVDKNGVCSLCSERKNMMLYRV